MKKFLTVLLVVSVLFTFSFSSAFAAEGVKPEQEVTTRSEAIAKAQKEMIEAIEKVGKDAKAELFDEYVERFDDNEYELTVDGSVYAATIDAMVADYVKAFNEAAKMVKGNAKIQENYANAILEAAKTVVVFEYNGAEVELVRENGVPADAEALAKSVAGLTAANKAVAYYDLYTLANIVDEAKAYVNGELAKVDMSLYTNDVIDKTAAYPQTWAEKAAEIKAELAKVVADTEVDMTKSVKAAKTGLDTMFAVLDKLQVEESYKDIYKNEYVTSYRLHDDYGLETSKTLADDKLEAEVDKAALKAELASRLAVAKKGALEDYNNKITDKAAYEQRLADLETWAEVMTVVIEEGKFSRWYYADEAVTMMGAYEAAENAAAIVKLQVEKDGSAKYDAAKVDEILAGLKVKIFAEETYTVDFSAAEVKEDMFAWKKEVKLATAKKYLADALEAEDYYAPEVAKIEAEYAKVIAKIEAAANQKQLDACADDVALSFDVDCEEDVIAKVAKLSNTAKFETAVENFIKLYNLQSGAKSYEDAYIAEDVDTADVAEYLAEQGARKNADVAALLGQAEAFAQTVKNNGTKAAEAEAALAAANAAIKALPTVITLADKAAVEAAFELAEEVGYPTTYTSTKLAAAVDTVRFAEDKAIDDMIKALPAKITVADEAAVDAILAAVEAYEETEMYAGAKYDQASVADAKDDAVKAAELAAVHAAIAAINAADEASVEAARAAVDAYVAEYTDPLFKDEKGDIVGYRAVDFIQNIDKLTYAEAEVALAKIEAVEALKITASSKATKGAITVKWTVKGDTSAVEGYEIWKSTKKNSGFKKAFTATKMSYKNTKELKKGTRYYYKVRAIAYTADGTKIKSDWSNKAYRVAK